MFEESLLCLFLRVMGKAARLTDCDRRQILTIRQLGTNIFETALLMDVLWSAVVSTYVKLWMIGKPVKEALVLDVLNIRILLTKREKIGLT